ncbi:hypothetical protein H6F46_09385 [Limnothrix sp. FACHB-1083]|uniref:hypothetical protein n=1 Tax=unclassified Limnothrix TaxID=2632864 RepID=UPI0016816C98|nr:MULTISPECIES: hypothetical protein [unclassified Limnothrix]MBD2160905.1 hypothetical protein [Limnothrix sp. FACHB-1083]MBD2191606.1 hypothetical protein [Limnothrix sp. FACHB-1088]
MSGFAGWKLGPVNADFTGLASLRSGGFGRDRADRGDRVWALRSKILRARHWDYDPALALHFASLALREKRRPEPGAMPCSLSR